MKFVSPLLKNVVYPSLSAAGFFRRRSGSGLAVVTYHGVLPEGYKPIDAGFDGNLITADALRKQLRLLKANYNVISPEDALAWREGRFELPRRAVLLTCDDGLLNNLTDILPVLQQENLRCLFFVTGASAGDQRTTLWYEDLFIVFQSASAGEFEIASEGVAIRGEFRSQKPRNVEWWDAVKRLSQVTAETRRSFVRTASRQLGVDLPQRMGGADDAYCRRFGLLTLPELRALASAGMTIGAHTMSHPLLSQLPLDRARDEVVNCRTQLEAALQTRVWAFAYPFGDTASVTPQVLAMPQEAGYAAAFLNFGGGLGASLPAYALPRIHVTAEMNLAEFDAHVSGFHARLQEYAGRAEPCSNG